MYLTSGTLGGNLLWKGKNPSHTLSVGNPILVEYLEVRLILMFNGTGLRHWKNTCGYQGSSMIHNQSKQHTCRVW